MNGSRQKRALALALLVLALGALLVGDTGWIVLAAVTALLVLDEGNTR